MASVAHRSESPFERGARWRDEFLRRAALAREPQPEGVRGPPLKHLLGELEGLAGAIRPSREEPEVKPALRPRKVMLLPGFGTHPVRMRHMATKLEAAGHKVKRWGLGFNFGPTPENLALLERRLLDLHRRYDEPVVLVGWSLGGVFARELAKRHPEAVAKVITMGSPFSGDPHSNNAWRIYQFVAGHPVDQPPLKTQLSEKPPVPTVAMWSPRDGIVSARASCGRPGERDKAVAVRCSHLGFAYSAASIEAVLQELETD